MNRTVVNSATRAPTSLIVIALMLLAGCAAAETDTNLESSTAEPTAGSEQLDALDGVILRAEVVAWGDEGSDARRLIRDQFSPIDGWDVSEKPSLERGPVIAIGYEVTNQTERALVLFGPESDSFGLPTVSVIEDRVRLVLTNQYPENVDFVTQPYVGGYQLEPGETFRRVVSMEYPFHPDWTSSDEPLQPDEIDFCVTLTDRLDGRRSIGESSIQLRSGPLPDGVWEAVTSPPPIEVCQVLTRLEDQNP